MIVHVPPEVVTAVICDRNETVKAVAVDVMNAGVASRDICRAETGVIVPVLAPKPAAGVAPPEGVAVTRIEFAV